MKKEEEKSKMSLIIDKDLKKMIKKRAVDEEKTITQLVEELLKKAAEGDCDEQQEK